VLIYCSLKEAGLKAGYKMPEKDNSKKAIEANCSDVIRLRPHHLLCSQGYSGKGYSDDFVIGMDRVVQKLREDPDFMVDIRFSTDSICVACPSKYGEGLCKDDDKVLRYDACVREILGLEEGLYSYQDLIDRLDNYLMKGDGDERLRSICGDCNWYPVSACSKNILSKRFVKKDALHLISLRVQDASAYMLAGEDVTASEFGEQARLDPGFCSM
jgi:hypothetical protein